METTEALAERLRNICPKAHEGHYVPLQIFYSEYGWTVRYVKALKGSRRVWGSIQRPTLRAALEDALKEAE